MTSTTTDCEVADVVVRPLTPHPDDRGVFLELFREQWDTGPVPKQWNVVLSKPGVLRGVHVHRTHHDYLTVASGTLVLGLYDLRPDSPTHGTACLLTITGESPSAVAIPPGVCHGFYYPEPTVHIYGVSEYWNLDDELGCRYDDPALALRWPVSDPSLSPRDLEAGSFAQMRDAYLAGGAA